MFGWGKKKKEEKSVAVQDPPAAKKVQPAEQDSKEKEPESARIKIVKREGCYVTAEVELPVSRVEEDLDRASRRVQARVKMPGFRPGKVPLDIVQKNFASDIRDNAVNHVVREGAFECMLHINALLNQTPAIENLRVDEGKAIRFDLSIECAPEVRLETYKGLAIHTTEKTVTDQDVADELERYRERHAKLAHTRDDTVGDRHFVVVDYESFLDGAPLPDGKAKNQLIDMSDTHNVAGFVEGLRGAKDGETRDITVLFPPEHSDSRVAGKNVSFKVTVTAIKEKKLPEMDDEFAKDLGFPTLDECRRVLRVSMEISMRRVQRFHMEQQLAEELLARHTFEVPRSLVENRARELAKAALARAADTGAAPAAGDGLDAEIIEKFRTRAERDVRLSFVLTRIESEEKIRVEESEVDDFIRGKLDSLPPAERKKAEPRLAKSRDDSRHILLNEKTVDFLIQHARVNRTAAPTSAP